MADGGDYSSSVEDGSDIVFECTPCTADGSRVEAFQFCATCDQFLCNTCTKYHQRFTKSHRLAPAGSTKHTHIQTPSRKKTDVAKCHFHPDRDIEMYCGTHDMVYCSLCVATEHRSCNDVEQLKKGVHKSNTTKLLQLVVEFDQVHGELRNTKRNKSENKQVLKTRQTDILEEIDKLRNELNDRLDLLESEIKAELDGELTKIEEELDGDIDAASKLLTTLDKTKPDVSNTNDDIDMFIAEKLCKKVLADARIYVTKSDSSTHITQNFEPNALLYDTIKTTDRIGRIVRNDHEQRRAKYVVKSHKRTDSTVDPTGMCQLQDGVILLVDHHSNQIKSLDDQPNVNAICALTSTPYGLCPVSSSEVVVRTYKSIQFIRVGRSLCLGRKIKIKPLLSDHEDWYGVCNSIAFCDGTLWTIGIECIYIYSTSGHLVKKISTLQPRSLAVSNNGAIVYATVGEDTTVVFNNNGDVINELRDHRLVGTRGICVTEDDVVFVAGHYSNNVVMFDKDGNSLGELVPSTNMPSPPQSLCYDKVKCRLLVGFDREKLQIYELNKCT